MKKRETTKEDNFDTPWSEFALKWKERFKDKSPEEIEHIKKLYESGKYGFPFLQWIDGLGKGWADDILKKNSHCRRKIEQEVKKVINNPCFQKEIKLLRKKLGIPKDGLRTWKKVTKWENSLRQKEIADLAAGKLDILWHLTKETKEIPEDAFTDPIMRLAFEGQNLSIKLGLSDKWDFLIGDYAVRGGPPSEYVHRLVLPWPEWKEITGRIRTGDYGVFLRIYGDTTLRDIKDIWKVVKMHQKDLKNFRKRTRLIQFFDRNQKLYKLHKKGISYKKIYEMIDKNKEWPKFPSYDYIAKIIRRHKKYIGEEEMK